MQELKLIVAGGRDFNNYKTLSNWLVDYAESLGSNILVSIVSGMARGADSLAVQFAEEHSVKLYGFPAEWDKYGNRAGYVRNDVMAEFSDALMAFCDGKSRDTEHMINAMLKRNKPIFIVNY